MRHGSLRLSMVDVEVRLGSSPRTRHPYSLSSPLPRTLRNQPSNNWRTRSYYVHFMYNLIHNFVEKYENQNNVIVGRGGAEKDRLINIAT